MFAANRCNPPAPPLSLACDLSPTIKTDGGALRPMHTYKIESENNTRYIAVRPTNEWSKILLNIYIYIRIEQNVGQLQNNRCKKYMLQR